MKIIIFLRSTAHMHEALHDRHLILWKTFLLEPKNYSQFRNSDINFSEELFKLITFPHLLVSCDCCLPLWTHHREINVFYHSPRTMSAYRATDNCQFRITSSSTLLFQQVCTIHSTPLESSGDTREFSIHCHRTRSPKHVCMWLLHVKLSRTAMIFNMKWHLTKDNDEVNRRETTT